jgi:hypothetical protein
MLLRTVLIPALGALFFAPACMEAQTAAGPCDLNSDGVVNVVDVQKAANMYAGLLSCTANIEGYDVCNTDVVTRIVNAALGSVCITGVGGGTVAHSVTLTWTASTSANIAGYNIYRSSVSGGPYTKINSTPIAALTFLDTGVQAGQPYDYVVTAVDTSGNESVYSTEATTTVPSP